MDPLFYRDSVNYFSLFIASHYAYGHVYVVFQNMSKIPEPTIPTLDPNDDNIILEIPEDKDPSSESKETQSNAKKEKVEIG